MAGVVVPRGDGPVRPLPVADGAPDGATGSAGRSDGGPPDVLALEVTTALTGTATVRDVLVATHTDAFLVLHDGVLVCEHHLDGTDGERPHPLFSVTKSLVGCLAGRLLASGDLDEDAPVTRYLPDLAAGGYATATVRDVLDMRTGGDHRERYGTPDGASDGRSDGSPDGSNNGGPDDETAALAACAAPGGSVRSWLATAPRAAGDRSVFSYRSADTEVLGRVVEAVAGRPLPDLVGAHLLGPLGAESDGVWETDGAGEVFASGGLALRPRDLARFGQMLLDGGAVGKKQLVPARFLRDTYVGATDSVAAFHARLGADGLDAPNARNSLYRNQFWVVEAGRRLMLGLGVHGQALVVDGDNRVVVAKLSSWPVPQDPLLFDAGTACAVAVAEALGGVHEGYVSLHR